MRGVSKHEGAPNLPSSSFRRAYARSSLRNGFPMRAPQDEDERVLLGSRFQTAHLVPAARFLRPGCASLLRQPNRGMAERRETFGCSGTREACPHASDAVNALMTPHARRLARRLASRPRRGTLASRRSTVAVLGSGAALLSPAFAPDRSQRTPRTQVVVPGGDFPSLPGRAVTSRRRRTPRLAPPSGSSREHALNERGCK